jgi:peptide/nickel transport system ATP-binding protein
MNQENLEREDAVPDDRTIMEVRDLSVRFEMERGESRVLNDVSLDITDQEILGIVGESGSGKSMFASALLDAVVEPGVTDGEITYYPDNGDPVDVLDLNKEELRRLRWEEISMVFQGALSSFNPVKTIRFHFHETIDAHDVNREEGMEHARELLSNLYLDPDRVLDSYPHELSGGMKQRALIALSLVLRPNVLVMDEPTAALDLLMQRSILSLLKNLKEEYDLTVLFITHDLPLVAGLADRLGVLYAFEFVEVGPADDIIRSPTHPYTRELLNAVPNLQTPLSEMESIEGSSPDPVNVPSGCSYHPRCELADEHCVEVDPELMDVGPDHTAACHYWERSLEEIPLNIGFDESAETMVIEGEQSVDPVVSLEDVKVHFEEGGGLFDLLSEPDTVRAVDGVDLDLYENDVVALVGESGCGKTTLGKTAIAIQRPTAGSVRYRDQEIWETKDQGRFGQDEEREHTFEDIRRALQIIHQDPGSSLNPNRIVQTTLASPLKQWRPDMPQGERQSRILSLLEHVGMTPPDDYAERYPHQLSGGEKQRVALIRAMLVNPDLILADEAVSALDVSLRVEMMDLMLELQDIFDTSYLFISHNLSNARYFAGNAGGRIGVMYLGKIVEIGPAEQIINDPQHPYTKVLKWSTADLDVDQEAEDPPVRGIDIPDPIDPPSGCSFHTRCPEAREYCAQEEPVVEGDGNDDHSVACFRQHDRGHPYWSSEPLEGVSVSEDEDSVSREPAVND